MSLENLILTYGYPLLFIGVLIEGEAFLVLGTYLAHRGYFSLPLVITVSILASFLGAQLYFYLGHRYGRAFLAKRPKWQQRFGRVETLLHRYGQGLVVGFRALYGLRTVIPASLGLANYPAVVFTGLNAVGAVIWGLVIALAGNGVAQLAETLFSDIRRHERVIILVLAGLGILWGLYLLYSQPKLKKQSPE